LFSASSVRFKLQINASLESEDGDSETLIRTKALEKGVLALPGTVFLPDRKRSAHVRAAFSLLGEEEMEEALRRLACLIREEQEDFARKLPK
jgi:tryptophan aminotransferase